MINEAIQDSINRQITMEMSSSYAYLALTGYYESINLRGFAHWYRVQAQEESQHAMKLFDYLNDRGGHAMFGAIREPQSEFASPLAGAERALEHERAVSASIHALYQQAVAANDAPTQSMLKWFIDEQVEEEKNAEDLIADIKLAGEQGLGLFLIDRQLAARAGAEFGAMPAAEA